jgi:hypothetical protein
MNLQGLLIAAVVVIAALAGPPGAARGPVHPSPARGCR